MQVETGHASELGHLILASASRSRREMLKNAGIAFTVQPADVDEAAIREALGGENGAPSIEPGDVAEVLARAKAVAVSELHRDATVIGGDQVLAMGDRILAKPPDPAAARRQLLELKGKTHALHSAVALAIGGEVVWSFVETAQLRMRPFSDAFLEDYLNRAGESVLECVGAYQIERLGIQLFDLIEGDHFTVLGLPLLPLMDELRARGLIIS